MLVGPVCGLTLLRDWAYLVRLLDPWAPIALGQLANPTFIRLAYTNVDLLSIGNLSNVSSVRQSGWLNPVVNNFQYGCDSDLLHGVNVRHINETDLIMEGLGAATWSGMPCVPI